MIDVVLDGSLLLAVPIAMLAGLVSFASPCVLPLAPGYLAYVTGLSGTDVQGMLQSGGEVAARVGAAAAADAREGAAAEAAPATTRTRTQQLAQPADPPPARGRVLAGATLFVLGFTAIFVSFGAFFGGAGMWLLEHQRAVTLVLGAGVVVLGLGFLGLPLLQRSMWWNAERRLRYRPPRGLWGAPLLGVVFAVGWTPCIGPTLAAVQSLAFTQAGAARGAVLSAAYCLGLGIPFLVIALGLRWSVGALAWTRRHSRAVSRFGGAMLVAVGLLLMTGLWSSLVVWLQTTFGGFTVVV